MFGTTVQSSTESLGRDCTVGEIILSAGNRPVGLKADGRVLAVAAYPELFSIIGATYGGNGSSTFALPDLRSMAPNGTIYSICDQGIYPTVP
ncbi:MAG: phage tail protein [Vicinamibacterales bacterium]